MQTVVPLSLAEPSDPTPIGDDFSPSGIHVLDGSYVLNVGEMHVNITNHGLIGSHYSIIAPYSDAPSAQWPGGSGDEYLYGAGLWVGARVGGEVVVSTGQYEREFRPGTEITDTIYEAKNGKILRPFPNESFTGRRMPEAFSNDDGDYAYDEETLNGVDDDGDGLIDEDFAQRGDQMFTCTMYDNLPIISEIYPSHRPLNLKVVQRAFAWGEDEQENIIGLEFEITNIGFELLEDVYLGFYVDCDIRDRSTGPNFPDDMAGFYQGAVRAENGTFYRADIAYMFDAADENPLPGYFGVMLIDHTTEFVGTRAPFYPSTNSFQIFSANATVTQEGEPISDEDRYDLMARHEYDDNTRTNQSNDLKFMISSGPFPKLEPGQTLTYRLALIIGDGLDGMLQTATQAGRLGAGRWFNQDGRWDTGNRGRETKVCLEDYPPWSDGSDPILGHRLDWMNAECAGFDPVMFYDVIWSGNLHPDNEGRLCVWVNMDNCEECFRARGENCVPENFLATNMYNTKTGVYSREKHFPWSDYQETPPPAPNFRIIPGDRGVELFWNDQSEYAPDPINGVLDFESYQVWRANNWTRPTGTSEATSPPTNMWGLISEFDIVNFIDPLVSTSTNPLTLGRNTGLASAVYIPACLIDQRFAGLAEEMQLVVDSDIGDQWKIRPPLRSADGSVVAGMEGLMRWESYQTVLDTFFTVCAREASAGVVGKRSGGYYHYRDTNQPNGLNLYYAVTATDHALTYLDYTYFPSGYGFSEKPANLFQMTTPRPKAQTVEMRQNEGLNIYVYPNPATNDALEEYLAQAATQNDPTGVRVTWNNLPLDENTIRIFTVSGDLVQTLYHDGFTEAGSTSWNLMSRNGQDVANGIYLYVVHSNSGAFDDVPGKFVIIR